ncbi:MAG: ATP-binding cassette domain-containing protein [Bdellovibrionales bacterium]
MVTIVAVGSYLVYQGQDTVGQVVTFVGFSTLMIHRLEQISSYLNRLMAQAPTLNSLFELIDHPDHESLQQGLALESEPKGHVTFENVSFQYGQGNEGVFNLSFDVEPGQTMAFVGPSGAGKTTCLALLQRLFTPKLGRILIDGVNIADLSVESLCGSIATVFQEPGLFNRSVYENILVGRPTASRAEVEDAARRAEAHDFIMARPEGYDFVVGERGLALSGGERQRIAIARAFLKNAPILLLDEATSALDNETEKKIQEAMSQLRQGRTTFMIAHRLSTIIAADKILVLSNGRVVESGTFTELRSAGGLFARLLSAGTLDHNVANGAADGASELRLDA